MATHHRILVPASYWMFSKPWKGEEEGGGSVGEGKRRERRRGEEEGE